MSRPITTKEKEILTNIFGGIRNVVNKRHSLVTKQTTVGDTEFNISFERQFELGASITIVKQKNDEKFETELTLHNYGDGKYKLTMPVEDGNSLPTTKEEWEGFIDACESIQSDALLDSVQNSHYGLYGLMTSLQKRLQEFDDEYNLFFDVEIPEHADIPHAQNAKVNFTRTEENYSLLDVDMDGLTISLSTLGKNVELNYSTPPTSKFVDEVLRQVSIHMDKNRELYYAEIDEIANEPLYQSLAEIEELVAQKFISKK